LSTSNRMGGRDSREAGDESQEGKRWGVGQAEGITHRQDRGITAGG
jgi:hypothetical protein